MLVCSRKCYFLHRLPETTYCLCINHPENNTIRSHFCQRFIVIQTFTVRFNVVRWMKMRSQSAKLISLPIKNQNSSSPSTLEVSKGSSKDSCAQKSLASPPMRETKGRISLRPRRTKQGEADLCLPCKQQPSRCTHEFSAKKCNHHEALNQR